MKFYQSGKEAVIWNPEKDCMLAEFKNGMLETKSKAIIDKLNELGYQSDPSDGPGVSRLRTDDEE